ncbi:MAG: cytochrome [Cyanobacteria bacterium P01_A01_bin.114]
MGPGDHASEAICKTAYALGYQIARQGWVLLTGGRNVGVMDAASQGAVSGGGLTVGILPGTGPGAGPGIGADGEAGDLSDSVIIPIFTDMGSGRNNINVLSSRVVVACGLGPGTASEVALALKAQKPVVLMQMDALTVSFFRQLGPVSVADTAAIAVSHIKKYLAEDEPQPR